MYKKLLTIASMMLGAACSLPASATLIASNTTPVTVDAQTYSNAFALSGDTYSNVTLDITAKGDYGFNFDGFNEYFRFFIDGVQLTNWSSTSSGISVTENYQNFDYTLTGSIDLTSLWSTFAADSILNIFWQNTSDVGAYPSEGGPDYVSFSINGIAAPAAAVPEPMSLALLALGLGAIAFTRSKRKAGKQG